mmetsp:Transcript_145594/g.378653  ORF Transcript_145594/g.378653 Transcript_145594/m.378653 type:complete len:260 (-) Transcript_145594:1226-2005(-)
MEEKSTPIRRHLLVPGRRLSPVHWPSPAAARPAVAGRSATAAAAVAAAAAAVAGGDAFALEGAGDAARRLGFACRLGCPWWRQPGSCGGAPRPRLDDGPALTPHRRRRHHHAANAGSLQPIRRQELDVDAGGTRCHGGWPDLAGGPPRRRRPAAGAGRRLRWPRWRRWRSGRRRMWSGEPGPPRLHHQPVPERHERQLLDRTEPLRVRGHVQRLGGPGLATDPWRLPRRSLGGQLRAAQSQRGVAAAGVLLVERWRGWW